MKLGKWLVAVMMTCAVVACGDDDDPSDPGNSVADPEGTVTLRMRNENSGRTYLSEGRFKIYIDEGDNFVDYGADAEFVNLGHMKGLGNITKIPKSGWASKVAVTPGCGYIAHDKYRNEYIRIYVVDYVTSAEQTNGVIGFNVKYQYPFALEGALALESYSVELNAEAGSSQTIKYVKYAPFTVTGIPEWLKVTEGKEGIIFTALSDNPAYDFRYNERGVTVNVKDGAGLSIDIYVHQQCQ